MYEEIKHELPAGDDYVTRLFNKCEVSNLIAESTYLEFHNEEVANNPRLPTAGHIRKIMVDIPLDEQILIYPDMFKGMDANGVLGLYRDMQPLLTTHVLSKHKIVLALIEKYKLDTLQQLSLYKHVLTHTHHVNRTVIAKRNTKFKRTAYKLYLALGGDISASF